MVFPENKEIIAFISLGSNLGDREKNLRTALRHLEERKNIRIEKVSALKTTKPFKAWGPDFLNGVVKIATTLSPGELLGVLQSIENLMGRRRSFKNEPRIIDLDMLLYGDQVLNEPDLTLPHPGILERDFIKDALLELEPALAAKKPFR
ncbi:MAG: 2-amino-4-hydroxy-6-hydroxymethyldihydropteridine diphosphokinase [Candidatus Omnitrophica bacterium]|nr:2-amino-4-hydroxy-6-hydroxymethyldihydropteridine diphosphokinase [Candidatus Omnitrophota bacterium]